MDYRVYLLDADKRVVATETFAADDDVEAGEIALALHSAWSDTYEICEVWRGGTCLVISSHDSLQRWETNLHKIRQDRQQRVIELEGALQRSYASLRESDGLPEPRHELRAGGVTSRRKSA